MCLVREKTEASKHSLFSILQTLFSTGSVSFFIKMTFKFLNFDKKKMLWTKIS